jgi:hypothetical protein
MKRKTFPLQLWISFNLWMKTIRTAAFEKAKMKSLRTDTLP